jgi:S1-C subfamily serine protease
MKKLLFLLLLSGCVSAQDFTRLVKDTEPKVVKIGIVTEEVAGTCSGAIISSDGLVLTCAHCFLGHGRVKKIFVKTAKGEVDPGAVLIISAKLDLALVVTDNLGPFPFFKFGPEPEIGQEVFSFGSPLGIQHTFAVGYVANRLENKGVYLIHSAFINPGNSGGPLVDYKGRLVGINEATINVNIFQEAQGLFIAIDQETIRQFLLKEGVKING